MEAVAEFRGVTAARCDVVVVPARPFPYSLAAAGFILFWTLLNLLYLAFACPHDLAPDEAHYWHWSRSLDWSYYSKGPLVAWLIRGSCELFGNTMFAVRLPAVLCSAALLAGLYLLIADVLKDRRLALGTMLCAATLPGISAGAVLMTIDPPYLSCWCWSLVGMNRAIGRGSLRWWAFAGICTAFGILAKYPMVLLPAIMLAWSPTRKQGSDLRPCSRVGLPLYLLISCLGGLPILLWNARHGWVSFQHVVEQTVSNGPAPLAFVGGQAGVLLGFWFVAFAAAAWRFSPKPGFCFGNRVSPDAPRNPVSKAETGFQLGMSLMWWASVPVWGVFFAASFRSPGQVNWPAAAYIGGTVLAAAWLRDMWHLRAVRMGLIVALILGCTATFGLRFPQFFRPILAAILPVPSDENPTPIRKLDVTSRLAGWRTLAAEIDRQRKLHPNAILAGMTWTVPGELAFHCDGHPEAYTFGPALADRRSQYDLWRPNPVSDPDFFRGCSFIYVGESIPEFEVIFERVEGPIRVTHSEAGVPLATWTIWVCHGFRGFPPRHTPTGY